MRLMRVKVKIPKLGLTMTEATIVEWLKAVGEPVTAGEALLVIETEKAEVEVEAPASGTLVE
ncbi:MAG: biotin attachment protein, partial [Candidatus Rokubacteria bacterium GWF2_70_14]